MGNIVRFNSVRTLSLFALLFSFLRFFEMMNQFLFAISLIGRLYLLIIFPFMILGLKKLITTKYELRQKKFFNLLIGIVFISAIAFIIEWLVPGIIWGDNSGTKIADKIVFLPRSPNEELFNHVMTGIRQILFVIEGLLFIILERLLSKSCKPASLSLRTLKISLMLFGIYNVVAGIALMPFPLHGFYVLAHKTILPQIINYLESIAYTLLFLSLFMEFCKEIKSKSLWDETVTNE